MTPPPRTTLSETSAIASGDSGAFSRFYEQWFDVVYAEARRLTGRDESFCLDVAQDVFMRCIRSLRPISAEPALRSWLKRVVHSISIDHLRADARRRRRESAHLESAYLESAHHESAQHGFLNSDSTENPAERVRWLENELAQLGPESTDLLLMRHRFGWTLDRIGAALGLGAGAVDGRLRRVVTTLRRQAEEIPDE